MALYLNGTQIGQPKYNGNTLTAVYYNGVKVWPDTLSIPMVPGSFAGVWCDPSAYKTISWGSNILYIENGTSDWNPYQLCLVINQNINLDAFKTITITGYTDPNGGGLLYSITPNNYVNVFMNRTYPSGNIGECTKIATSMTGNGNTLTIKINSNGNGYIYLRIYLSSYGPWDRITSITFSY